MASWFAPEPGDIVWCHFPHLPDRDPGPKPRPGLVLRVDEREDGVVVEVVYGTSKKTTELKAGEFAIRSVSGEAYRVSGLSCDTKFDFKVKIDLPWSGEFFKVAPGAPFGQSPKLGTLHASLVRAAATAHAAAAAR